MSRMVACVVAAPSCTSAIPMAAIRMNLKNMDGVILSWLMVGEAGLRRKWNRRFLELGHHRIAIKGRSPTRYLDAEFQNR